MTKLPQTSLIGNPRVAQDSAYPLKKHFYRDLIASLRKIGGKNGEITEAKRPQSRARIVEIEAQGPGAVSGWMKPKEVRQMISGNCSLIRTVKDPAQIEGIERRLKRIYENRKRGRSTPTTLQRYLEQECDLEDWQAKRIVIDQMNKFDAAANLERLRRQGVKLVRWCHGTCKDPRPYHVRHWDGHSGMSDGHPNGLAGFVFSIDEPPVIDEKTGQRGWPGDLIYCSCHLEAVE